MDCREKYRLSEVEGIRAVEPNVHYHFGSVVHKIAESYWAGKPFMDAFHAALALSLEIDLRLVTANNRKKYEDLVKYISPITRLYYERHMEEWKDDPAVYNEHKFVADYGVHEGIEIVSTGTIDRLQQSGTLSDLKTAAAIGTDWKSQLKKRLLREPQLPFYRRYAEHDGHAVSTIEYEVLVKPYRGSDPFFETIDVTDEFMKQQKTWEQQADWAIREIAEFHAHCLDVAPWPQSTSACTSMIWGECEYLPICLGQSSAQNSALYQIESKGANL